MDLANNIPLMAGLAAVTMLWSQLRGFLGLIRSVFVCKHAYSEQVANAVWYYLVKQSAFSGLGDGHTTSCIAWIKSKEAYQFVAVTGILKAPRLLFWRRVPILLSAVQNKDEQRGSGQTLVVSYVRGTLDTTELSREAMEFYANPEAKKNRYEVATIVGDKLNLFNSNRPATDAAKPVYVSSKDTSLYLHFRPEEVGPEVRPNPFDFYTLSQESSAARSDITRWYNNKGWYKSRGIPWRRGHLLEGPPGTGKTSLVVAMAQELGIPLFVVDLTTMNNVVFREKWNGVLTAAPCIALFEDIDAVFEGRKNVVQGGDMQGGLSFDCFLNAIGGAQAADGVFVVATTNKPHSIDEALLRPGRLDRRFTIGVACQTTREGIIKRICGSCTAEDLTRTDGKTAAAVTEWAMYKALTEQLPE